MTRQPTDTFQIAISQDGEIVLIRKDPENLEIVLQTSTLRRHEGFILFDTLINEPEYQERALKSLMEKNIARPNHGPESPIL